MKIWFTYISSFVAGIGIIVLLLSFSTNPENAIVGQWDEITWEYEQKEIPISEKDSSAKLSKNFLIHKAEKWSFEPDGTLLLITEEGDAQKAAWSIKGRGHILQIKYANDYTESYNIDVLNNNALVLNFEDSLEVRGISKLTFNRLTN